MMTFKKALSALLVLILLLGICPPGVIPTASAFTAYIDVSGHWGAGSINRLNRLGFIDPEVFTGNRFRPNSYITRVELFSMLVRSMGAFTRADVSGFNDLAGLPEKTREIVAIANQMGIAFGYTDGTMRPNDNLLRQEAAALVARALGMSSVAEWNLSVFTDSAFIAPYARTYVSALVDKGILAGYQDSSFRPNAFLTRAEAAKIIDSLFNNVYMPETGFNNVYLQGSMLIQSPGADIRDAIIDGDLIIGDGVGNGSVVIANSTINGRLIVRGGGSNSVTISGSVITEGLYVASFSNDTRISITNNSTTPVLDAVSGFTLAGSGVPEVNILENARRNSIINLTGVNLNDLTISGPGAQVRLNSGHVINTRFGDAGQGASLNLAANTSVGHLTISAPNVAVTGTGALRNLIINHSGAVVAQTPELLSLGVNVIATVSGRSVASPESQWSNNIDRVSGNSPLKVELLSNTTAQAPFDQTTLRMSMVAGRTSSDVHLSQSASARVPLTQRGNRWGYWIGFFVPAPPDAGNMASITYTHVDGDIITLPPRALDTHTGRLGLLIYLPVFREPGREVGVLKEVMYINWGGHLTENIQFLSSTIHLAALNSTQRNALQRDFDNKIMYSIQSGASPYTGAEATRRILASDNPLGLPSTGNRGLDAMNRAVSSGEARAILEDPQFSRDFNIDTSGNSQYSALSDAGKTWVAEQVLAARRTLFASPASVKAAFDRAVQQRLASETTLLGRINSSADYDALRRIIETAANAAILQFQTGADPYKSYTASEKDAMADYLWRLRQYRSIQEVIDAIRDYLGDPANAPGGSESTDIRDMQIQRISISVSPNNTTVAFGQSRSLTIIVDLVGGRTLSPAQISSLIDQGVITLKWDSQDTGVLQGSVGLLEKTGLNTYRFTNQANRGNDSRNRTDRLTFALIDSNNKRFTATVSFTAPLYIAATGITRIIPEVVTLFIGMPPVQLEAILTPANTTETAKWTSSRPDIASVNENTGVVTPGTVTGIAIITARIDSGDTKTAQVRVFKDANDVIVDPSYVILTPGGSVTVTAYLATPGRQLIWTAGDDIVVTQSGTTAVITANRSINPAELPKQTTATVTVTGSNPSSGNDFSGRAIVDVEIRQDTGITARLRESSVMYSGQTNYVDLTITDEAMLTQQFYIRVTAIEPAGSNIARFEGGDRTPVRVGDDIKIIAADTGIGRAMIRIYTSPDGGDHIAELYLTVAPKSPEHVEFHTTQTLGSWYPGITQAGTGERYPAGVIDIPTYGRVLTMQIADRPRVRAITPDGELRGMSWNSFVSNQYREILHTVRTGNELLNVASSPLAPTAPSGAGVRLLDRNGEPIPTPAGYVGIYGSSLMFEDVFEYDGGPVGDIVAGVPRGGYEFHTPSPDGAFTRLGFFKSNIPDAIRAAVLRAGGLQRYTTSMTATDGNLIPDNTVPTGLAAVVLTPRRNPMSDQLTAIWGDLYYRDDADLFTLRGDGSADLVFNPFIAPQSGFTLRDLDGNALSNLNGDVIPSITIGTDTINSIYDIKQSHVTGTGVLYRLTDINGIERFGSVNAIMIGDPNFDTNTFYVRLLPDPIDRSIIPSRIEQTTPWLPQPDPPIDPPLSHVREVLFIPGSRDSFDFLLPGETPRPLSYPHLVANFLPGGQTDIGTMAVRSMDGTAFFVFFETPYPEAPPTIPFTYLYSISQWSKEGFAPTPGVTGPRQLSRESTTYTFANRTPLEFILTMSSTEPMPTVTLYYNDAPLANNRYDLEDTLLIPFTVAALSRGYTLIDLQQAEFEVNTIGIGDTLISILSPGAGNTILVGVPNPSPIANNSRVIIIRPPLGRPLPILTVSVNVQLGIRPAFAPLTVGISTMAEPVFSSMPDVVSAATAAGIDLSGATFESTDSTMMTIDEQGVVTPRRPGRTNVRVRSRDGTRSVLVAVEIQAESSVTTTPPEPPPPEPEPEPEPPPPPPPPPPPAMTALTLRATAGVGIGKTMTLAPFVTPFNSDKTTIKWSSSDTTIATVEGGTVTGIKAGTVTITATNESGSIRAQCRVTVRAETRPTTSLVINRRTLTLNLGATSTLSVSHRPTNASIKGATWTSSDERVARVEPNGKVVAVGAGTAVITATSDSGARTASCTVTVRIRVASVTLPEARITLKIDETYQINPVINPTNATETATTYATNRSSVASVSASGLVTARRVGSATITVRIDGKTTRLVVTVTR